MIYYDYYTDIPPETVDAFVESMEMGRLVTVSPEGRPHIGLYPFVYQGAAIELEAGAGYVVPRGVWHTARVRAPARVLHVTPGARTQHRPL